MWEAIPTGSYIFAQLFFVFMILINPLIDALFKHYLAKRGENI